MIRVAIIQFPGSNCEEETRYACERAGMKSEVFHWLRNPGELDNFHGFILPGGFSYQDRVRAGAIAAKEPIMERICELALEGKPLLGICNGAQILVESGLVPGLKGTAIEMALAGNVMKDRWGFYAKFVFIRSASPGGSCLIDQTIDESIVMPIPIAHAEGRYITADDEVLSAIENNLLSTFKYCDPLGNFKNEYPINPNGAILSLSALSNPKGNIVSIMPHPERCAFLRQIPLDLPGEWGLKRRMSKSLSDDNFGPGMEIFLSLKKYIELI